MYDLLNNVPEKEIKCLDKGFVRIVDCMPRLVESENITGDSAIVQMARTSYGNGTKTINEDKGLIRYLLRHAHTSPFEAVEMKFHLRMPIFVCRQWVRHRTANLNEISGRYSVLEDNFYEPELTEIRKQSTNNKQGGDNIIDPECGGNFSDYAKYVSATAYEQYERFLSQGVCKEQARMILPINLYTELYWKCDLHNILHFLALRCDSHSQLEIRVFADAMLKLITPLVPYTIEAWNDYHPMRGAVKFTRLEMNALRKYFVDGNESLNIDTANKREQQEWSDKLMKIGLTK